MLVQKRYCDYDYDSNMIILFDPQDEERRPDDQLDIYWISCGNEAIEDIPIPQTRSPPKKSAERAKAVPPPAAVKKKAVISMKAVKAAPSRQPLAALREGGSPGKSLSPETRPTRFGAPSNGMMAPFNAQYGPPGGFMMRPQWNAMPNVVPMGPHSLRPF